MSEGNVDIQAIRAREFPICRSEIYLDNAGRGLLPQSHVEAVGEYLRGMSEQVRVEDSALLIEATRERAARLLECDAANVALLSTTSQGLNLVPAGLDWRTGDEVIVYEFDHPTDIYAWLNLADRGVTVRFIKDRGECYDVEDVERLIGARTRAICVSLVNYGHGFRAPLEAIGELCQRRGIWLVVDAIMALGALRVQPRVIGADILVAHGYKFLLSGFGVAICYCSPRALSELRVAEVGYKAMERVKDYARQHPNFQQLVGRTLDFAAAARRFEAGTQALAMVAGMKATLGLMLSIGTDVIDSRVRGLAETLAQGLRDKGYRTARPTDPTTRSAIVTFNLPGVDSSELSRRLKQCGIHHHTIHQRLRLSPHFYNDASDIGTVLAAL